MGNCFKGLGLIYDLGQEGIIDMHSAGVQLGYFYQFGVFSYILTAIINQSVSFLYLTLFKTKEGVK
jgi:hypothetical protein